MPVPAWWWKPVRDKPKKPCNMLLARKDKFENWEYRVVFGNFDYFVFSWEAQCWCEIQAP